MCGDHCDRGSTSATGLLIERHDLASITVVSGSFERLHDRWISDVEVVVISRAQVDGAIPLGSSR
jgi:hypothetical protein